MRRALAAVATGALVSAGLLGMAPAPAEARVVSGHAVAFGANDLGQLGDGTTTDRSSPVAVQNLDIAKTAAAGCSHTIGLTKGGSVVSWGDNVAGDLGDGTTVARLAPVSIGLNAIDAVGAGCAHSLAVAGNGTVFGWGANAFGQLGDGTSLDRHVPVQIPNAGPASAVSGGASHSLALRRDGTAQAWGDNAHGQLGNGTTIASLVPTAVQGLSGVKAIASGCDHNLALLGDGTVRAWGANARGQLGNGTTLDTPAPVIVPGLTNVTAIAAGCNFSMAQKSDGSVLAWGANNLRQLGDGTTTDQLLPVRNRVPAAKKISAGNANAAAIAPDGSVWTWGANNRGQIGNGTVSTASDPEHLDPTIIIPIDEAILGDLYFILIRFDTTVPTVDLTTTPPTVTNQTTAEFGFLGDDPDDPAVDIKFICAIDGHPLTDCAATVSFFNLVPGNHSLFVQAVDPAGNLSILVQFTWLVDTTSPTPQITGAPPALTNQTSATFSFTATDPDDLDPNDFTFTCQLDGGSVDSCTSPTSYSALTQGSHTFTLTAFDEAGNSGTVSYTWSIDLTVPVVVIDSGPPSLTSSTSAAFTFHATDAGDPPGNLTLECQLDGGAFAACSTPGNPGAQSYTGLGNGTHTFTVRASDAAGNSASASLTWTIDTIGPDVFIDTHPSDPSNFTSATFTFHSSDPGAAFTCSLDGAPAVSCTSPTSYTGLADGSHTFTVTATDGANNSASASFMWTIDTTAPNVVIDSGPSNPTNSTSATFTFHSDDPGATFTCSLDGGPAGSCISGQTYTGLADGPHTFTVTATDGLGNSSSASFTWTVDTVAPNVVIDSGPNDPSNSSSATFTFHSDDPTATFTCSVDGGPAVSCSSPTTYTGLADGAHSFTVTAADLAGNSASATFIWTIDATAPNVVIDSGPSDPTNSTSATFAFHSDDPGATLTCSLDGGPAVPCSSPTSYTGLADGSHTFTVTATDGVGNSSSASFTWTVDTVGPGVIIDSHPNDPSTSSSATFTFHSTDPNATFTCSLDGGPAVSCSSPTNYTGLSDGSHLFTVTATDLGGNSSSASFTWTIDTSAPTVVILTGPANPTTDRTATFTFSASDANDPPSTLTTECSLDGSGFVGCASGVTFTNLGFGSHTFSVRAKDPAGNIGPAASYPWVITASTQVVFEGPFEVAKGDSFTAFARMFSPSPPCVNGKTITLTLERNPVTGVPGAFVFATVVTNDAGAASSASPIATATWQEGLYTVGVSFAGSMPECAPSSSASLLRIGRPTTLVAKAIIAEVIPGVELTLGSFTATLTEGGPSGPPIAGQVIHFSIGGDPVCDAVTDANGKATCGGLFESVEAILNLEYTAVFDGADLAGPKSYLSSRDNGPLVRLAGVPILPF